jgi:hypothetical protein
MPAVAAIQGDMRPARRGTNHGHTVHNEPICTSLTYRGRRASLVTGAQHSWLTTAPVGKAGRWDEHPFQAAVAHHTLLVLLSGTIGARASVRQGDELPGTAG